MLGGGYTDKQVEEMKDFLRLDGWKDDPSLPSGWMAKRTKRHAYFLSEGGKFLNSGREAEEYIQTGKTLPLKLKAQKDDHESMQNNLLPEGWIRNEFLPEGWMHKKPKSNFAYIWVKSREMTFKSTKQVVNFLNRSDEYSNQDVERFSMFPDGILKTYAKIDGREWVKNDFLPEGWKFKTPRSRSNPHYIWVKSREGVLYKSAKQVVELLNSSVEYSNKDVQQFALFPDGKLKKIDKSNALKQMHNRHKVSKKKHKQKAQKWLQSENLPEGWLYREHNKSNAVCAKLPDGTIFNSYIAITNFFKANKKFTENDINNLVLFQQEYREKFPPTKDMKRANFKEPTSSRGLM